MTKSNKILDLYKELFGSDVVSKMTINKYNEAMSSDVTTTKQSDKTYDDIINELSNQICNSIDGEIRTAVLENYLPTWNDVWGDDPNPTVKVDTESIYSTDKDIHRKREIILSKITEVITMILKVYPDAKDIMGITSFSLDTNRMMKSKYYAQYKKGLNLNDEWSESAALVNFEDWLNENIPGLYDAMSIYSKALKNKNTSTVLTKDDMKQLNSIHSSYKRMLE